MKRVLYVIIVLLVAWGCQENYKPKPQGFLALNFPEPKYKPIQKDCPYTFEVNKNAIIKPSKSNEDCTFDILYPNSKGVIYITYDKVEDNLDKLLADAQQLPLKHTIKADEISGDEYVNSARDTYGMLYTVTGDAASQAQFYITDSTKNFMTGSIYFRRTPNYDSIFPAAEYLKDDMKKLMETLEWKNRE